MGDSPKLYRIGAGFCGTVWAAADHGSAFKREDGGPDRSIINDYNMHRRIHSCMKQEKGYIEEECSRDPTAFVSRIQVPACYDLLVPTCTWWNDNLGLFPHGYQPCNMIHAQRISPVSEKARKLLIETYCPPQLVSEISSSETNRDCLLRPYLGRRRTQTTTRRSRFQAFSLRNYPLHVDQMEEIGLSTDTIIGYARAMAEALAVMHWVAEVDGNDVEFVLAAPNDILDQDRRSRSWSDVFGEHQMWLLDFDLVREITMDSEGVQKAVKAFWKNDPFFPRPDAHSELWKGFRGQYLQTSERCISRKHGNNKEVLELPGAFIYSVENTAQKKVAHLL